MKSFTFGASLLLCVSTIFSSCQKDTATDGQLTYSFKTINLSSSVASSTTMSGVTVAAGSNNSINWTSGTLNIQKAELDAKKEAVAVSYEYKNLTTVDLLSAGIVTGSIAIPMGTYSDVEVKLSLANSAANPPLTLKGIYTDGAGVKTNIQFVYNEALDLKMAGQKFVIASADKYVANVTLELNSLVKTVETPNLTAATRTNGEIVINATTNRSLYDKIVAKIIATAGVQIVKK